MKICLDAGHGGEDRGASHFGLDEKDVALTICRAAHQRLQWLYWTAVTRNTDEYVPPSKRVGYANEFEADIFISVHTNADPDLDEPGMPEASGEEIWVYPGSEKALKLATYMETYVDQFFPSEKFRGIKQSAKFYVLKHTKMPAILIECGFLDNNRTNLKFRRDTALRRIGHLISQGVRNYAKA